MLGYEDVVSFRDYTTSVKCVTETGTLYKLNRDFFNNMMMRDEMAQKSLVSMANKSDEKILKIIKNGSINIKHQISRNRVPLEVQSFDPKSQQRVKSPKFHTV